MTARRSACRQLGPRAAVRRRALARLQQRLQLGDRPGASAPALGGLVVPAVEDLQEDPLRPAVELLVDRRDGAPVVVAQPQPAQLALHRDHVVLGGLARMLAGLDGVLLGGQAERVVAQAVQDVLAGHPLEAGVDVGGDVAQRVADVQARHRRGRGTCPGRTASRRPATPSGSAQGPAGFGAWNVPSLCHRSCQAQLDALGQLGGVAVRGVVHRLRPSVEVCGRCSCGAPDGRTQKNPSA